MHTFFTQYISVFNENGEVKKDELLEAWLRKHFRFGFELEYIYTDVDKHKKFQKAMDSIFSGGVFKKADGIELKIGKSVGADWKGDPSVYADLSNISQGKKDTIRRVQSYRKEQGLKPLSIKDFEMIKSFIYGISEYNSNNPNSSFTFDGKRFNINFSGLEDIIGKFTPNFGGGGSGREYASPDLPLDHNIVVKIAKLLSSLKKYEIYTNESCGFHTHISWPGMNSEDMFWIALKLAYDKEMFKKVTQYKDYKFYTDALSSKQHKHNPTTSQPFTKDGRWSAAHRLFILTLSTYLNKEDWDNLDKFYTSTKQSIMKLHPGGTLEFRGPRGFMDKQIKSEIFGFFKTVGEWVDFVRRCLGENTITNNKGAVFTKEDIFVNMDRVGLGQKMIISSDTQFMHFCSNCRNKWQDSIHFPDNCPECDADRDKIRTQVITPDYADIEKF